MMYKLQRIKVPSILRIKLRSYEVIDVFDNESYISFKFSIEDSTGLLELCLSVLENSDPVERFCIGIKDLYRDYLKYNIYSGKYKYSILKNNYDKLDYQLHKVKMY